MKLFIDEDLSPQLVSIGHNREYDSTCVRDRAKLGRSDREVLELCIEEDRVIVTANASDFTGLCGDVELHPGLITLPDCNRATQQALLEKVLTYIEDEAKGEEHEPRAFMVNRVVEVELDASCSHYDLPSP